MSIEFNVIGEVAIHALAYRKVKDGRGTASEAERSDVLAHCINAIMETDADTAKLCRDVAIGLCPAMGARLMRALEMRGVTP